MAEDRQLKLDLGIPEPEYIFRASITLKDGRKLIAAHYGLKAFKIPVRKPANDNDK